MIHHLPLHPIVVVVGVINMTNKFIYNFTPENNGGECVTLEIDEITQKLSLQSYANICELTFCSSVFTLEKLKDLTNKLEEYLSQ